MTLYIALHNQLQMYLYMISYLQRVLYITFILTVFFYGAVQL